jgi:GTP-binding protein
VTRDRHQGEAWTEGRSYLVIDTGGLDHGVEDPMQQRIAGQVAMAIDEADVIVCLLDASTGVAPGDAEAVGMLRRTKKPVVYAANKADTKQGASEALDLYRLGVDSILPISALHGRGIADLEAAILAALPPVDPEPTEPADTEVPRVAIIGRPNAGKSSLLNRIAGKERMLVDDRPGTTRDAIDVLVTRKEHRLLLIDTAGIRRKGKVAKEADVLEGASVMQAVKAMERCDLALLICDAAAGVAEQDAKILGLAVDRGRAIVVALNKIDLLPGTRQKALEEVARDKLSFAPWAPMVPISAKTGRGTDALLAKVRDVYAAYQKRVGTGELNRFFEKVLATHPPPTMGNRAPRLFFITQAESSPPLFIVMTNEPEHIHFSYRRFLINQLRAAFGFEGVPIRVTYRKRRRRGDEDEDSKDG